MSLHILSDCVSLENFWTNIFIVLKQTTGVDIHIKDVMFICGNGENLFVNIIVEEAKWQVWKRRCKIRYENDWINDTQMIKGLKNALVMRQNVLSKVKNRNEHHINQLSLFLNSL